MLLITCRYYATFSLTRYIMNEEEEEIVNQGEQFARDFEKLNIKSIIKTSDIIHII